MNIILLIFVFIVGITVDMSNFNLEYSKTSDVIRYARNVSGLTQKEFGKSLGRTQGEISKYERGTVDPPGSIIIHCMNILTAAGCPLEAPSVDRIVSLMRERFHLPEYAMARAIIMRIMVNEENRLSTNGLK